MEKKKSSRSLDDLISTVRDMAMHHVQLCADADITLLIYQTYRSPEDQDALYARGRATHGPILTNAKAGQSMHQYGVAYDCVPLLNGKPVWGAVTAKDSELWHKVGQLGKEAGLDWAGDWSAKKREYPHFQYTGGLTLSDFLAGRLPK
ncbi:MAG: M15 family metallopeptidase [Methylophilus sp.]